MTTKDAGDDSLVRSNEILARICENYYAIYLLDTENDSIIPLKLSPEAGVILKGSATRWSEKLESALGELVMPEYLAAARAVLARDAVQAVFTALDERHELLYQQKNGTWKKIVIQPLTLQCGRTTRALVSITDVTESKRQADAIAAEKALAAQRARNYERLLIDAAAERFAGIIKINIPTGATSRISFEGGVTVEEDMRQKWDKYFRYLVSEMHPDDRPLVIEKAFGGKLEDIPEGGSVSFTYRSQIKGGGYRWYTTTLRASADGHGCRSATAFTVDAKAPGPENPRTATAFTVDINDEMIERARLKDLSEHDGLTDLFNRVKLEAMMETEYRQLSSCAVLFFDVNDLKLMNDLRGHEAGNALLCQVADSIRSIANRRIHSYRYGGDEFITVVCDAKEEESKHLLQMWKTRLDALSADSGIPSSVAVGTAWSGAPLSVETLIDLADGEMYCNKERMKQGRTAASVKKED